MIIKSIKYGGINVPAKETIPKLWLVRFLLQCKLTKVVETWQKIQKVRQCELGSLMSRLLGETSESRIKTNEEKIFQNISEKFWILAIPKSSFSRKARTEDHVKIIQKET